MCLSINVLTALLRPSGLPPLKGILLDVGQSSRRNQTGLEALHLNLILLMLTFFQALQITDYRLIAL